MISELKAKVRKLYKPPFRHEHGYIYDSENQMLADQTGHILRIRGWGRLSYLQEAEKLQDGVGELIAEILTDYWNKEQE